MNHNSTPLADALKLQAEEKFIAFDVPGHKSNSQIMNNFFGEKCISLDKNSRESIDYLCQPNGVIYEAEKLAADAFGAEDAFFMVGGTTSAILAMVMCVCTPGDKIILPRNVHYSVINAVILSGAIPVYIDPCVHPQLGIALGIRIQDLESCIRQNTDAKAILINNPTYYGICSDVQSIVKLAHENQMMVIADEAHGTHFYFNDRLPEAALHCGADLSAVSMHKTGGSLTQSSILLSSGTIKREHILENINLICTTSASYLLLASLDIARKNLALNGKALLDNLIDLVEQTRSEINKTSGFYSFSKDIIDSEAVFDYDVTKLSINTLSVGLTGIEVYTLLRDNYHIQVEFGDVRNLLAMCTVADTPEDHKAILCALKDIAEKFSSTPKSQVPYEYIRPLVKIAPRKAFYAKKKTIPLTDAKGKISACAIMSYPPGIPILAPGELITDAIIENILFSSEKGCSISGIDNNLMISIVD